MLACRLTNGLAFSPCLVQAVAREIRDNLETGAPKLSLARLDMDILPESILEQRDCTQVAHIRVLDLKHNALQLLPSELFLCLTQLQEVDVSKVGIVVMLSLLWYSSISVGREPNLSVITSTEIPHVGALLSGFVKKALQPSVGTYK